MNKALGLKNLLRKLLGNPDEWFRPKAYGVGIEPGSWQGIVILVLFVVGLVVIAVVAGQSI
ncbi:hypothetical protein [Asticcacaulis tiandongensis]|uniref:hypothetical protein n=1 Tax=Asticcacaulis tiandongensis TaxID=2565365 RepID=UPI001128530A|nr:hypothetical protein [Asticcacaulis tiandongensis]